MSPVDLSAIIIIALFFGVVNGGEPRNNRDTARHRPTSPLMPEHQPDMPCRCPPRFLRPLHPLPELHRGSIGPTGLPQHPLRDRLHLPLLLPLRGGPGLWGVLPSLAPIELDQVNGMKEGDGPVRRARWNSRRAKGRACGCTSRTSSNGRSPDFLRSNMPETGVI